MIPTDMKRAAILGLVCATALLLGAGCGSKKVAMVRTATVPSSPTVQKGTPPTPPPNIPLPTPVKPE